MTLDDVRVQIVADHPWISDSDLAAILAPDKLPGELELLVQGWQEDLSIPVAGPSSLTTLLEILGVAAQVAGYVLPIVGVLQVVVGAVK
jgi:hypothetical protein